MVHGCLKDFRNGGGSNDTMLHLCIATTSYEIAQVLQAKNTERQEKLMGHNALMHDGARSHVTCTYVLRFAVARGSPCGPTSRTQRSPKCAQVFGNES